LAIYAEYFYQSSGGDVGFDPEFPVQDVGDACRVRIKNLNNGAMMKYTLVAENEADLKAGKISLASPFGKGLAGKAVGDIAEINAPAGIVQFEILDISF
jgi:transcription elongation factor GreA